MIRTLIATGFALLALAPSWSAAQPSPTWPEHSGLSRTYDLSRARILVIVAPDFNADEAAGMAACWKGWGARVEFAGPARDLTGEVEMAAPGTKPGGPAPTLRMDYLLKDVDPSRYDLVYIAGGEGVGKLLDTSRLELARILDAADRSGRLVAAVCHGPLALSASGVVKGKRVTVQGEAGRQALLQAAAILVDDITVVDDRVITGQWPHLETFAVTVAERLQYPDGGGPYQRSLEARSPVVRAMDELRGAHRFDARPVPQESLEQIVRAAMRTLAPPTTRGSRAIKIVVVRDQRVKSEIASRIFERCKAEFASRGVPEDALRRQLAALFDEAPALLFLFVRQPAMPPTEAAERVVRSDVAYAGAAGANLALAARSMGLGVSPLGLPAFLAAEPEIKRALQAPDAALLVNILSLGYPSLSGTPAVIRPVAELLSLERWNSGDWPR